MNTEGLKQHTFVVHRMDAFDASGLLGRLTGNITRNSKSFFGRDYKAWAQMCIFVLWEMLTEPEKKIWLALTKVFFLV